MLRLALLGGLHISLGEAALAGFVSRKAQALLAYLAVTGRPHHRAALAGLLWGDLPEARAAGNLRVVLANLHDLLPHHLDIARTEVAFDRSSDHWLDVAEFERACQAGQAQAPGAGPPAQLAYAAGLYCGDFLEGFYVHDAPAFEEWALIERERLRQMQLQALHALTRSYSARGEHAAAIEAAGRLLALDPWREEAHRELMRLLALSGQRSAALAQYEQCRRLLRDELGLEPLEETTALYGRLVSGEIGTLVDYPNCGFFWLSSVCFQGIVWR
jgi:DNA-binding SARP family transcriptional activator